MPMTPVLMPPSRLRRLGRWFSLPMIVLGAVAALGMAPLGWWWLALPALAVILHRINASPAPARMAFAAGLGYFALGLSWIVEPFLVDIARHGWMAPFALVLMAAGGAAFWAVSTAIATRAAPAPPGSGARLAAIACALFLSDWLRGWIFTGFPWARLGQMLTDTPLAQAASVIGALGLSALVLAMAGLAALRPRLGTALALALGFGVAGWGQAQLNAPHPPNQPHLLRLVQPDAQQALKWDTYWSGVFYARLLNLSAGPGPLGQPDLVIWPETAVSFVLEWFPDEAGHMAAAAAPAQLVTGIQRERDGRFYNSLIALGPDARIQAGYDKAHLVPFGEYIPYGEHIARLGVGAFAAQAGAGYTPGPGMAVTTLPGLPAFQPLICYEAIFPFHLREAPARPDWLLQITNDAWFGQISGPWQHLEQARLRAIESGLPLIRVANTGVSAVIDARGRVRAELGLGALGRIDAHLPGALPATLWMRRGDAPLVTLAFLILGLSGLRARGIDRRAASA